MTISTVDPIIQFLRDEYGLDELQAPAANHLNGPALVLASAGSGKTTTLTARVTHLIKHHKVPADQILCITFTNKATENMVSKITAKIGEGQPLPTISTIHSLGLSIIRKYPQLAIEAIADLAQTVHTKEAGHAHLSVWSERNCSTIFRKICEQHEHTCNYSETLSQIMYLCNRGFTPASYEAIRKTDPKRLKQERVFLTETETLLWRDYILAKYTSRALDFTDMLLVANRILERNPKVLQKYHDRWNYILQDEAQDASPLQWNLLYLLSNSNNNIFCVGDASQSIMSFNGAEVKLIKSFENEFKSVKTTVYPLMNNYRSHPTIINVANAIEHDLVGNHPSPMIPKANISGSTPALSYKEYYDSSEEANDIARTIQRIANIPVNETLLKFRASPKGQLMARKTALRPVAQAPVAPAKQFKLKDIAILVRSKIIIPTIENALLFSHIPYYVRDGKSLLQSKEVMDLLAYLRLCINPFDEVSFDRAVQTPKRGFGDESVKRLIADARLKQCDVMSLARVNPKLLTFTSFLDMFSQHLEQAPKEISKHIETWIGTPVVDYKAEIKKASLKDADDESRRLENINRFKLLLQQIMDEGVIETLPELLDHISLMQDAGASNSTEDRVHIMTAHSVKGLEYDVVFAPCFFDGSIPHHKSKSQDEINEEARLTYVIVTRAIRQLRVSRPITYASRGSSRPMQTIRSRFLEPMRPFFQDANNLL